LLNSNISSTFSHNIV